MENKDLLLPTISDNKTFNSIVNYMPEHSQMLGVIKTDLPEITRSTSFFGKTQSQFMDNIMTVSHPTPIRNLRQILAEIQASQNGLKEAYFKSARKEVELKMKMRELEAEKDELKRDMISIDIAEIQSGLESSKMYLSGAIRKVTNYVEQYNAILKAHNLEDFNEAEFEKEEEKYHIMKAFDQAMCAARAHGGVIDEGNMIYFTQLGINGSAAQSQVFQYLGSEGQIIQQGAQPSFDMYAQFLENMASMFAGCSEKVAKIKGMNGNVSEIALVKGIKPE